MYKHVIVLLFLLLFFVGCHNEKSNKVATRSTLPCLYITLEQSQLDSILLDRNHKAPADAVLIDSNGDTLYDGPLKHIKTRGNATFTRQDKKPFSIKFTKTHKLFHLDKSKSFVLLANAYDESHLRNAIAFDVSRAIGLPTPHYVFVSLYINDKYNGLYQMTNKVEINKHALDITDLEKLNKEVNPRPLKESVKFGEGMQNQIVQSKGFLLENTPEDITGGYLLEIIGFQDRYKRKDCGFMSSKGELIIIREPEHASKEEVDYIADYYDQMETALHDPKGYNALTGKHYSDYLDVYSFAKYYILNELVMNLDAGITSCFMYKDCNSKMMAGPSWDFDASLNYSLWGGKYCSANQIWAGSKAGYLGHSSLDGILYILMKHDDFRRLVYQEWNDTISPICHHILESGHWDSLASHLSYDAERDFIQNNNRQSDNYSMAVRRPLDFLHERIEFLDWLWTTNGDDVISVADSTFAEMKLYEKYNQLFYRTGEPIIYPTIKKLICYDDPIPEFFIAGTDSIIPNGTVLNRPAKLEIRWRGPTWKEVQIRRVKKKINQIFG